MNRFVSRLLWVSLLAVVLHPVGVHAGGSSSWQPAHAPLMTRWASAVSPTNSHPEYPRPQLVRAEWQNLNGLWEYAIRPLASGPPTNYDGEILCPSLLSRPCRE